ncbi:transcription antitermination factor NusB [Caulobacter sp. B11]|uniref:transcription antitermination factor NusB n=1 Tax=Caulobacter sp. B11 TaxID=2048899 RepID=UPI000C12DB6A|nr:transcription antitermination factor NusB [Caulobacter sp. B11]PHY13116.1 transcription antitermination factor NusB [Caulobacter sp. B11]
MSKGRIQPRSVSRLAAVQALYQMEVSGVGVDAVVREFAEHRFDRDVGGPGEGDQLAAADETFFAELAKGVVANQAAIDQAIVRRLASGWRLERLDATARAVLRAGAFELLHRLDVPTEVVIDEYVEIAKSFFEGPEAGFINGALDAIARDSRV